MKGRLAIGFIAAIGLAVGAIWLFSLHETRLYDLRRQKLARTFESNRSALSKLVDSWEKLPLKMNSCGEPEMAPGLVHYAVLERKGQHEIRVGQDPVFTQDGFDVSAHSVEEAAKRFTATTDDLSAHLKLMDSISITAMFQHDAELHFVQDSDSSLSLMYVPSHCRQFSNYPFWDANKNGEKMTPFARINQLAPSWFLVEDKR
jgi:hypothetical protein